MPRIRNFCQECRSAVRTIRSSRGIASDLGPWKHDLNGLVPLRGPGVQPAVTVATEEIEVGEIGRPATPSTPGQPVTLLTGTGEIGKGHAPEIIEKPGVLPDPGHVMLQDIIGFDATEKMARQDITRFCNSNVGLCPATTEAALWICRLERRWIECAFEFHFNDVDVILEPALAQVLGEALHGSRFHLELSPGATAPKWHKRNNPVPLGPKISRQIAERGNLVDVGGGHRRADSHWDAGVDKILHATHGPLPGAGDPAETVVDLGSGTVETDLNVRTESSDLPGHCFSDKCPVRGHRNQEAAGSGMGRNLEPVRTNKGFAAAQSDVLNPESCHVIDRSTALGQAQLIRPFHSGTDGAMSATQITLPGDVPEHRRRWG